MHTCNLKDVSPENKMRDLRTKKNQLFLFTKIKESKSTFCFNLKRKKEKEKGKNKKQYFLYFGF
jgi:hypothetical protein